MLTFELKERLSHKFGKSVIKPKIIIIIPPERYFQKSCGMFMKTVLALRSNVKIITDSPKDRITTNTRRLLSLVSEIDLPKITGKSGKIHGAKIVSTPATKDRTNNVMLAIIIYNREI